MIDPQTIIAERIVWVRTGNPKFPWRAQFLSHTLEIYDGDWPSEAAYTLYIDGEPVGDLEGWPEQWQMSE